MTLGIIYSLSCGVIWSLSIVLFKKYSDHIPATHINLIKNLIGTLLLIPVALFVSPTGYMLNITEFMLLFFSGFFGIGVADSMLLYTLKHLGAQKTAIIETTFAPNVILLSFIFLDEVLNLQQWSGITLVLFAVTMLNINFKRDNTLPSSDKDKSNNMLNILIGFVSIFLMANGILLIKPLFSNVNIIWIVTIRMIFSIASSAILYYRTKKKNGHLFSYLKKDKNTFYLFLASFLSTFVAMILWVAGYKYTLASISSVLNQTSTIFTVIFAAIFLSERITAKVIFAVLVAISGVLLISFS